VAANPPTQYATDRNLRARQRLWERQEPAFDVVAWTLELAGVEPGVRVLDVGCGNGRYLDAMRARGVNGLGCDLSVGILRAAGDHAVVAADAARLPCPAERFDVVVAPHMLYHVTDRPSAVREFRRVLAAGGRLVAVANGGGHLASLRAVVDAAAGRWQPGWRWTDRLAEAFSLDNGGPQLAIAFDHVRCVRPDQPGRAIITDPDVVAGYLASVEDLYGSDFDGPWDDLVIAVRATAAETIDRDGAFIVEGDVGAFICS